MSGRNLSPGYRMTSSGVFFSNVVRGDCIEDVAVAVKQFLVSATYVDLKQR